MRSADKTAELQRSKRPDAILKALSSLTGASATINVNGRQICGREHVRHHRENTLPIIGLLLFVLALSASLATAQTQPPQKQQQPWNFLVAEQNNTVGVRNIRKFEGDWVTFQLLNGYMPDGKQLGTGRVAGMTAYEVLHECGTQSVLLSWGTAIDLRGQILFEHTFEPLPAVHVSSWTGLDLAVAAVCRPDQGKGLYLVEQEPAKDEIWLVCRLQETEREIVVRFSESQRTVNGNAALISPHSIQYSREINGQVTSTSINRLTGQLTVQVAGQSRPFLGTCQQAEARKF